LGEAYEAADPGFDGRVVESRFLRCGTQETPRIKILAKIVVKFRVGVPALVARVSALASAVATSLIAVIQKRVKYGDNDCLLKPRIISVLLRTDS
jgi:hypothetical protein